MLYRFDISAWALNQPHLPIPPDTFGRGGFMLTVARNIAQFGRLITVSLMLDWAEQTIRAARHLTTIPRDDATTKRWWLFQYLVTQQPDDDTYVWRVYARYIHPATREDDSLVELYYSEWHDKGERALSNSQHTYWERDRTVDYRIRTTTPWVTSGETFDWTRLWPIERFGRGGFVCDVLNHLGETAPHAHVRQWADDQWWQARFLAGVLPPVTSMRWRLFRRDAEANYGDAGMAAAYDRWLHPRTREDGVEVRVEYIEWSGGEF